MSNTLKFGAGKWAAKAGSVLAYNDENNNFKPLPFTFTRASTATRVNESGLIESVASGVPRIDFLDNADGHLLLEPSRTNSLPYSEDFSSWQTSNFGTLTSGQTGFDGSNNAWLYEYTANAAIVQQSNTSSGVQTFSVFAKGSVQNGIRLYAFGTSNANTYFNLNLGTIGATSGATSNSIEDYGNGWYKCSMTFDQTNSNIYLYLTNNQNSLASSGSAYIQYAQLENGSYATSYIPTSGSSVTRAADAASQTPPSGIIGQTEGTLFVEFKYNGGFPNADTPFIILGTYVSNYIAVAQYNANMYARIVASGITQGTFVFGALVVGQTYKCAISYSSAGFAFYVNGSLVGSNSSITIPATSIFGTTRGSFENSKFINKALIYNTRLSNSELAAITSL